ncbi:hypothetical protein NE865_08413 [Phthorimaea operculella]|nr:hypothetical protein NE865_08413 [Phthorimaea operculella]
MPYAYTNQDYLQMVICYEECDQVVRRAQDLFFARFGVRPSGHTILGAVQRHQEHGVFNPPAIDAGRPRISPELEERVLQFFRSDPEASTRDAARVFNISHTTAWHILKEEGKHPYHFTCVQELEPSDYQPRVDFCLWLLENPHRNILWTDEATFTRIGMFNTHNSHYWSSTNPRRVRPNHFQRRFSVNVWAGIVGDRIVGPYFLPRINGREYLRLLRKVNRVLHRTLPLEYHRGGGMYYQHDGAPAHFSADVRAYLDRHYPSRWIGRGGPVPWPPRSPDLTPLDFFLWGRVKDLVYGRSGHRIRNLRELKRRIRAAFQVVKSDRDTLLRVCRAPK